MNILKKGNRAFLLFLPLIVFGEEYKGVPLSGSIAIAESCKQIMARNDQSKDQVHKPKKKRPSAKDIFPQYKKNSAIDSDLIQNKSLTRSPQTVPLNFTTATIGTSNVYPPDSDGAVGPTQFFTVVNNTVVTASKFTGLPDGVLNTTLDNFFQSVRTSTTTDPKVRFDRLSDHWFVICIDESTPNRVLLAITNDRVIQPSTIFRFFYFQQDLVNPPGDTGDLLDFPCLGIDVNALYIGGNMFDSLGNFTGSSAFVVQKKSMYGLGPLVVNAFRTICTSGGVGCFTPQGVENFDSTATQGFFLGVDESTDTNLVLRIVSNPGSTSPTISPNIFIPVTAWTEPFSVPASGSTTNLDAIDSRLAFVHIRNNQMWATHNIQLGTGDGVRWYQIDMTTPTTPVVVQTGNFFDPSVSNPTFYWIPSIMSSGQGHMALGFSVAGVTNFANAGTVGRLSTDPAGTVGTPVLYTSSSTSYNVDIADPVQRWGDFSYTSIDPQDNMTMWTIQEWCNATNSWGCQAAKLLAPPPATVTSASPSSVARGLSSVNVTINGTSSSGSGFYDPGSGFEKRISSQITGGVIVNSVTFVDATHVTLNINTNYATAGLQSVRIENPDGQQSIAAVLTIT